MMVEIVPYNTEEEEDRYVVLVNGIDEIGEHMSLSEAVSAAEHELFQYQGYTVEEAEIIVNYLIQDFL
jgi:hypothetical protein